MPIREWRLVPLYSSVRFSIRHMLVSRVHGKFTRFKVELGLGEPDLAGSHLRVEIDAASLDTGVGDRDRHLRSEEFLDVVKHPLITYRSRRISRGPDDRLRVVGDLTVRDLTREVVLDLRCGAPRQDPSGVLRRVFTATASLDRQRFGVSWNRPLEEAGGLLIGEKVDVEVEAQFVQHTQARVA
jgi:polyisoprenoid-binding protein YceI